MVSPEKRSFFHFGKKEQKVPKADEVANKPGIEPLEDPRLDKLIAESRPDLKRVEFTHKPRHRKRK
jgi:hypothetical protein